MIDPGPHPALHLDVRVWLVLAILSGKQIPTLSALELRTEDTHAEVDQGRQQETGQDKQRYRKAIKSRSCGLEVARHNHVVVLVLAHTTKT